MKIFEVQTDLHSYKYPVVKLIICLVIIVVQIWNPLGVHYSYLPLCILAAAFRFTLGMTSIRCMYISIVEMCEIFWNRRKNKYGPSESKPFSIDTVLRIVKENDIIELEVYDQKRTITIGTSAMSTYTSKTFWDKRFYIEDQEYEKIEDFSQALLQLFPDGVVPVFTIDGLNPKHTVYGRPLKS